jgi:hypothetical protein
LPSRRGSTSSSNSWFSIARFSSGLDCSKVRWIAIQNSMLSSVIRLVLVVVVAALCWSLVAYPLNKALVA